MSDKSELTITAIDEAIRYVRVGNDYLERGFKIDTRERSIPVWNKRNKEHIVDDFGKEFLKTIPKFYDFCVVPDHHNYKQVIKNCFNLYHRIDTEPCEGSITTWQTMMSHVGGDQVELLWDYVQLVWQKPRQILPVLCLVSKEQGTGKSTFGDALSYLLKENLGFYTQTDLNSTFNNWVSSICAVFEEISDTKRAVNIIKAMSTARKAVINRKYQQPVSFDPFCKIIINTNSEDTFIKANENDIRYWVIRVPVLPENGFSPTFLEDLEAEVPAVIHFLENRSLSVPKNLSRMWFSPAQIRTKAFEKLISGSRSDLEQDLEVAIDENTVDILCDEFGASASDVCEWLHNKYKLGEVTKALVEMGYERKIGRYSNKEGYGKNGAYFIFTKKSSTVDEPSEINMPFDDEKPEPPFDASENLINFDGDEAPF